MFCSAISMPTLLVSKPCSTRTSMHYKKNVFNKHFHSWFQTFAMFCTLYCFFWVIPRRLSFNCRRFGTLCLFHLHRRVDVCRITILHTSARLWRWNRQSVPKRRQLKLRRQGITQMKQYNKHFHVLIQLLAAQSSLRRWQSIGSHKISHLLQNMQINYCVHKNPSL
jgi:hypothetical protein